MTKLVAAGVALLIPVLASAGDFAEIKRAGTLRVVSVSIKGGEDELWSDDPQRLGLEREALQRFCALHHVGLGLVPVKSWDELIPALLEGRGDIIAGRFTVTARRKQQIAFTVPFFPTRLVLLSYKPRSVVRSLADLQGSRIGTVRGTSMEETLRQAALPAGTIDASFAPGTLPESLRSGKVPLIALGIEQAIPELKDPNVQMGMFIGPSSGLAWGLRKDCPALKKELDVFLSAFLSSGEWNKLVVKYFGADAPELLRSARTPE